MSLETPEEVQKAVDDDLARRDTYQGVIVSEHSPSKAGGGYVDYSLQGGDGEYVGPSGNQMSAEVADKQSHAASTAANSNTPSAASGVQGTKPYRTELSKGGPVTTTQLPTMASSAPVVAANQSSTLQSPVSTTPANTTRSSGIGGSPVPIAGPKPPPIAGLSMGGAGHS
jgi:hypothetical protein